MTDAQLGLYAALVSLTFFLLYHGWRSIWQPNVHLPPSPASLPFVGNLFSIPLGHEYIAFAKLGEQLKSDIIFLEVLGQKIVVLNSVEAASELLGKRSASYSDRPSTPMVRDPGLMNWPGFMSLLGYGDLWRYHRRVLNNWLNMRAVTQFNALQERQAKLLLQRLLSATQQVQPFEQVKNETMLIMASTIFQLAYGYTLQNSQDIFFKEAQLALHNILAADFLVNIFPAFLYIPDWFPGTSWKRTGREWGVQQVRAKTGPYEWLKAQIASGKQQPSLLGALLQDHHLISGLSSADRDERLKEVGFILYAGGVDTTANFLVNLMAALVLNPHVQARAQQELDTILGPAVLPSISDKERLPYISNLIDEVLRVYPIGPLAMPHACFRDDTYRNYSIQKGTTILANIWAMSRDVRHYKDPEVFNPDRYYDPSTPRLPSFGWGRRKCPGIHFAEASVFITTASLLATYSFSKKRDESGQEVVPRIEVERNSIIVEVKPFDFEIKPRSEKHRQLILGAIGG